MRDDLTQGTTPMPVSPRSAPMSRPAPWSRSRWF